MAGIFRTGMKTGTIIPLIPPRIKFQPISECSSHSSQFRPILAEIHISADTRFWLKKKKNLTSSFFFFWVSDPSSSCFLFFFFLLFSSSSGGFRSCQSPFCFLFVCCTALTFFHCTALDFHLCV